MQALFLVFIGGGLGSCARYGLSQWVPTAPGTFPLATFAANMAACLLLGVLYGLEAKTALLPSTRLLLAVGFCGGFSTFSTLGLESLKMLQSQDLQLLIGYIALSLIAGILMVYLGLKISQNL